MYSITENSNGSIILRTIRRNIKFSSSKEFYNMSMMFVGNIELRKNFSPSLFIEQTNDGLVQAFQNYKIWYENRKSRAKVHIRMVAKLLYWHRLSVEKLWDPSKIENQQRILEMLASEN